MLTFRYNLKEIQEKFRDRNLAEVARILKLHPQRVYRALSGRSEPDEKTERALLGYIGENTQE
jgi:DNA-binding phage protein